MYPEAIHSFSRHYTELAEPERMGYFSGFTLNFGVYGLLSESMTLQTSCGYMYMVLGGHVLDLTACTIDFQAAVGPFQGHGQAYYNHRIGTLHVWVLYPTLSHEDGYPRGH